MRQAGVVPSPPAYSPRDFCQLPELFGRNPTVKFVRYPDGDERRGLAYASLMQHRFAIVVRGTLQRHGHNRKWLAEQTGMDYTRLGRLLNGHLPMRLSDIGKVGIVLDIAIPFRPEDFVGDRFTLRR